MLRKNSFRALTFLLAVIMLISAVPMQIFAQETSDEPEIESYEEFIYNLALLEELAGEYVKVAPGKDPLALVIKYIRTGVDRYNSGSWGIMAGYEDAEFAAFVQEMQDMINVELPPEEQLKITGLKNIKNFYIPNGDYVDIGHVFGSMDITYHNKTSINHADVSGWAGDLVDLLEVCDLHGVSGDLDEMIKDVSQNYLGVDFSPNPGFNKLDIIGDLDAYYIMQTLGKTEYENGVLYTLLMEYFTEDLDDMQRADFFLKNRLDGVSTRSAVRNAVYSEYSSNKVVSTLEGTREFKGEIATLRRACSYAFADYLCRLAGDYVDVDSNPYYTVFSTETSKLAPGITQELKLAYTADNQQIAYYIATGDITRDDVNVYANYKDNDPTEWGMSRVLDQANAAQQKYGDPESEHYVENYNVIASINADGFNMQTGEPGGLLVMNGIEYHPVNSAGFFAITKDKKAIIGSKADWAKYKDQVQEAVGAFGTTLVKDGKVNVTATSDYYNNRAGRTSVGITKTGKVVFMVLDGRQEPFSCGGSMEEIAQIMLEAGCVEAVNLDGGGSTTFVAKQEGDDELSVINRPSDGFQRSVSTSLMMVSTAPSSTAFDHAVLEAEKNYLTVGASVQMKASGVSATGNAAELPEGAVWTVSDERWGKITQDGKFTALRNGSVDVNLMLGDEILGTKTLNIVIPETIYFTRATIDAVYGSEIELPIAALFEGKQVAITPDDVVIALSNESAGTVDGFSFTGVENSGIKNVKITATLALNSDSSGSITVNLYKQGENTFDFDKATGGDRILAFDRQVTNSTTDDAITYTSINTDEKMNTSYIFAMDMTQIPIPAKLEELIYMLPGSDVEGASAWGFLLQLAERVSPLTEVTPVLYFDKNFDVDYSELKIVNEYFVLNDAVFNKEENSLTLKLNWIDQTQAIDPATANPLCLVSGIKLTPKEDASWDAKNRIKAVNYGNISYDIYLRASALYSFAQKPENQAEFGLYPYVHPENSKDAGGHFKDIYKEFEDTYTLVNALKNGWISEDVGYAYYVDGKKLTGIAQVDGLYYDFGEDGINIGQNTYTGLFDNLGKKYYAQFGKLATGWIAVGTDYYYFNNTSFYALTGTNRIGNQTYTFDNDGKLIKGAIVETSKGNRYYWAGKLITREWIEMDDGIHYANDDGYLVYGNYPVIEDATADAIWWHFDEVTGVRDFVCDGFVTMNGAKYYCENGEWFYGAVKVDDGIIFCGANGAVKTNGSCYVSSSLEVTAGLETGYYYCDANGYIQKDGFATLSGSTYYFKDYVRAKGLVKVGDDYYFFNTGNGKMVNSASVWIGGDNVYGLAKGYYDFMADGKMYQPDPNGPKEIIEENGKLYFTIDGVKQKNGLNELDGEYYYATTNGTLATDIIWVSQRNDLITETNGYFAFGKDGKMIKTGFVTGGGYTYYYNDTVRAKGFTKIGEDYYHFNTGSGKMTVNATVWVGGNNSYGLPAGYYDFMADGKMYVPDPNGEKKVIEENGKLYFTIDGVKQKNGLNELDGEYYYAAGTGVLATDVTWVSQRNGLIEETNGYFAFGKDGKMIKTGFVTGGGYTYYYNDTVRTKGFTKIGEDYYFFNAGSGKLITSSTMWVGGNNSYGLPAGYYDFMADGKMYVPDPNGEKKVIEENGKLYFTIDGVKQKNGLNELDGEYYYAKATGELATGTIWVSQRNGLIDETNGYFTFGKDGKMIKTGFVTGSGYTYYYENAVRVKGLKKIGDDYYHFNTGSGKMTVNATVWVGGDNQLGLAKGYYDFMEDGRMYIPNPNGPKAIVSENGKLYFTIDGVKQKNGLNELDGEYYYAKANGELATGTVWVSQRNDLITEDNGYYAFDENGKMIKTGFVTGGGDTFYYENTVKVKGLKKIGDDYYFFNTGSGKMAKSTAVWVGGNNAYGLPAGTYQCAADGKLVIA